MRRFGFQAAAIGLAGLLAQPLQAEVADQFDSGFAIALSAETTASKSDAWKMLTAPAQWWSSQHTWSGDAANLYIDSQATGCFCEKLPRPADAPEGQRMGSVEHGHIVYADPQRGVLRLIGDACSNKDLSSARDVPVRLSGFGRRNADLLPVGRARFE